MSQTHFFSSYLLYAALGFHVSFLCEAILFYLFGRASPKDVGEVLANTPKQLLMALVFENMIKVKAR